MRPHGSPGISGTTDKRTDIAVTADPRGNRLLFDLLLVQVAGRRRETHAVLDAIHRGREHLNGILDMLRVELNGIVMIGPSRRASPKVLSGAGLFGPLAFDQSLWPISNCLFHFRVYELDNIHPVGSFATAMYCSGHTICRG